MNLPAINATLSDMEDDLIRVEQIGELLRALAGCPGQIKAEGLGALADPLCSASEGLRSVFRQVHVLTGGIK